jgi:hypothetical protein
LPAVKGAASSPSRPPSPGAAWGASAAARRHESGSVSVTAKARELLQLQAQGDRRR